MKTVLLFDANFTNVYVMLLVVIVVVFVCLFVCLARFTGFVMQRNANYDCKLLSE